MKVICICGKAESGKDTVAKIAQDYIENINGRRVLIAHYGDLVKYICKTFFGWDGIKDEKGRWMLQYIGTDKIRSISPDYWADFLVNVIQMFNNMWDYVLIPDCRFPNEYEIYEPYGIDAELWRVERPNHKSRLTKKQLEHISETALDNYNYDFKIINDGTIDDLKDKVIGRLCSYWTMTIPCRTTTTDISDKGGSD